MARNRQQADSDMQANCTVFQMRLKGCVSIWSEVRCLAPSFSTNDLSFL